mmetsp:Transcript_38864/g.85436  ORF Transcript_38864/g.85436 Transcript_38864/m.85436 type:complete len:230 (-) Transcript_38864:283-972(-)
MVRREVQLSLDETVEMRKSNERQLTLLDDTQRSIAHIGRVLDTLHSKNEQQIQQTCAEMVELREMQFMLAILATKGPASDCGDDFRQTPQQHAHIAYHHHHHHHHHHSDHHHHRQTPRRHRPDAGPAVNRDRSPDGSCPDDGVGGACDGTRQGRLKFDGPLWVGLNVFDWKTADQPAEARCAEVLCAVEARAPSPNSRLANASKSNEQVESHRPQDQRDGQERQRRTGE